MIPNCRPRVVVGGVKKTPDPFYPTPSRPDSSLCAVRRLGGLLRQGAGVTAPKKKRRSAHRVATDAVGSTINAPAV